jgi:predicted molibdopterin-dependent oxidoreductase YjgC
MTNSMDDIVEQANTIFIIGSNTTENHPVFGTLIRQAVLKRSVKLIVADPRRIDITEFATEHVRHNPGTDIALVNGLMNIILQKGWEDKSFIEERTEGFEDFKETILQYDPYRVSEITGVEIEQLEQVAEMLAKNKPGAVLWAMGITQHTMGTQNVMTLANLQMLLGNMGVPGGGTNPLRGQNNVQGACDLGGLPNVYPGYQAVTNPEIQKKFEQAWGAEMNPTNGLTITEIMPGILEGKVKALYIAAENPIMSDPDSNHIRHCLDELEFMVLQEIFPTETSEFADVLLPGVSFAEKSGSFTNTERRLQRVNQAIQPLEGTRLDSEIVIDLAKRVMAKSNRSISQAPYASWDFQNEEDVMAEIAALTPIYAGASHERLLNGERLQWPILGPDHPGTPILHVGKFSRGKGKFVPTDHIPPAEVPSTEFPFLLSTGRVLYHWHGGEMTRRAKGLLAVYDHALIEINPKDASRLKLNDSSTVRVTSRRGAIEAKAWVTDRVPTGVIFSNFHFPEAAANTLTIAALDPIAKIPEYKVCAVKVEAI